jgi:hypothetical protein
VSAGGVPDIAEGLVVKPGDSLIVRVHPHTSLDQVDKLLDSMHGRFPDVEVTVIACEQISLVRRG